MNTNELNDKYEEKNEPLEQEQSERGRGRRIGKRGEELQGAWTLLILER